MTTTASKLNEFRMGVLDDLALRMYSYKDQTWGYAHSSVIQDFSLEGLIGLAHAFELDTLWIVPGSMLSQRANTLMEPYIDDNLLAWRASQKRDGTPRFLLVWRTQGNYAERRSVKIAFPEYDDRWPWKHVTDALTLRTSVHYLQDALDYEVSWAPGHVGQELIRDTLRKHEEWLRPAVIPVDVKKNLAQDWQFKRPLTKDEKRIPMWFHLFDKNSMYLAACTSATCGEGDPVHLDSPDDPFGVPFKARVPGLWKLYNGGWVWTPELEYRFADMEGWKLRPIIEEAWVWPEYHTALRSWGEDMWSARRELKDDSTWQGGVYPYPNLEARELAHRAVKSIYTQGLGWLAMESKHGDNTLYRPDWWSQVVATAYRNMGFKVRYLQNRGINPCYVNVDALGCVSDSDSIEPYQHTIMDRQGQLGGFKHVGSVLLSPDLCATFEADIPFRQCQNALLEALNGKSGD